MKVHEFRDAMGREWNQGLSGYTSIADVKLRRRNLLEDPRALFDLWKDISRTGLTPIIDTQYANWIVKKAKWFERQMAPYEQFIKDKDGQWICLHKDDGIKSLYPELYQMRLKQLDKLGVSWLWPFQREDVARMSMKNSNLLADHMGLGKTRQIIALGILYGCKHNLIVVEPKLKDEFVKEFKALGITDYQIITEEKHLKSLKRFNIIAYNMLWRELNEHTKKTFAKAMRRRFQFIAIDEAHKIKAKDSE